MLINFHLLVALKAPVEAYRERTGHYLERVLANPLYGTRENRCYLKQKGIHFAGKPLGRPKKVTEEEPRRIRATVGKAKNRLSTTYFD